MAAGNLGEESAESEKQAYAASRCKNTGEVVATAVAGGGLCNFLVFMRRVGLKFLWLTMCDEFV